MANRKFSSDLSVDGLQNLANELKRYANVTLPAMCEQAVSKLLDAGIRMARLHTGSLNDIGNVSGLVVFRKEFDPIAYGCKGIMIMSDEAKVISSWLQYGTEVQEIVSPTLMYEFGSGNYADSSHRGTFPNQTHAFEPYWSWQSVDGQWHSSRGIKPSRPMFHAQEEMYSQIKAVFNEVFSV